MNRLPLIVGALAATLALPAAASGYTAYAVTDLNLRACEGTQCAALTVIPGGAAVNVIGTSNGWNYVTYAGVTGYASANYLTVGYAQPRPPVVVGRPPGGLPLPYPVFPVYPMYRYPRPFYPRAGFSLSFRFSG